MSIGEGMPPVSLSLTMKNSSSGAQTKCVPSFVSFFHGAFQDVTWVAVEAFVLGCVDVAY